MERMEAKGFHQPDEKRSFEKGKVELIDIGHTKVGKATFEPGWRWSTHVKPIVKTESCEAPHFQYQVSGTMHVVMDDGSEREVKAGEVAWVPAGHDAWVVGDEPVVIIDFQGMVDYAKQAKATQAERPKTAAKT